MAISSHDIVPDSPTNTFATGNILQAIQSGTFSDGNLKTASTGNNVSSVSTIATGTSKMWYAEVLLQSGTSGSVGVWDGDTIFTSSTWQKHYYNASNGYIYEDGSYNSKTYSPYAAGDIIGIAYDADNGKLFFRKNETWQGSSDPAAGTNPAVSGITKSLFLGSITSSTSGGSFVVNFGQDSSFGGTKSPSSTYTDANGIGSFYYQPPTGALALCTANLPDPAIDPALDDLPEDYFKAVKYTGQTTADAGTWDSGNNILSVAVGFQPDFVWTKPRGSGFNIVRDSVRGSTYRLITDDTYAELSDSDYGTFSSTGFNLGPQANANSNNVNYIAWCFRAGGPPDLISSPTKPFAKNGVQYETLSAANITAGTITPTAMSVNTDAGFSIVSYVSNGTNTGSVGHGLNQKPDIVIQKNRDTASDWLVLTDLIDGSDDYLLLNSTTKSGPAAGGANATTFASWDRPSGDNMIAYCWHSVAGYSKCGSYVGNGSTDGPFVYCGFRPAFVMIKKSSDVGEGWYIVDTARDTYNAMGTILIANSAGGDNTSQYPYVDYVSNGFKLRKSWAGVNGSSTTYIFMAFAEQPFKFSNAR